MAMINCLHLLRALLSEWSRYIMANEQRFKSLNNESLNTVDLFSNRKRKGMGVSEYVRPGKAKGWSDVEVDRSRAIFWANCFLRILGRFWFHTLESKCCIKHVAFVWPPRSTLCNIIRQMLDDVAMCSLSPENLEFRHFTLLFGRGRQKLYQNL